MIRDTDELGTVATAEDAGTPRRVSRLAEGLVGSEILKIAADVRALAAEGREIANLTVGDFSPAEFRIPTVLERWITEALEAGETNYPPSDGMPALRQAVLDFYREHLGLDYELGAVLVTGGSRPGIYSTYRALVDQGERVIYPVPSWNNNHYCHLVGAVGVPVVCGPEDAFLPTREMLEDKVRGARMLALNSPLNPAGTAFTAEQLGGICDLVLEENARRGPGECPLYLLYDQVYWMLTFGDTRHVNPVSLRPEMKEYTVFIDGISKAFAATGVRVGWTVGPVDVTQRMASIVGHMGAWAPRAEQAATARLLGAADEIDQYHAEMKAAVQARLDALYDGLMEMRDAGLPVDAISPMGAIYLSVRFDVNGKRTADGRDLRTNEDIRTYLLDSAGVAVVAFQAFGSTEDTGWFRFSVGAVSVETIRAMLPRLRAALEAIRD
ncbi:MAG TPA: aminotransferase class I/II-fold pyridoxal phosphate-dependent enzyme [Longimicrobiaceae bacterium]|jgi:aspartate aminotransferase|nr:aminotransferase class I/II-fold pyridoxal phosphate-dependent enzyme [Longimicrobiaceae bacterium]